MVCTCTEWPDRKWKSRLTKIPKNRSIRESRTVDVVTPVLTKNTIMLEADFTLGMMDDVRGLRNNLQKLLKLKEQVRRKKLSIAEKAVKPETC